jgi:predicted permease
MKKFWKSKTVNFNVIYAAIIAIITQGFGITISPEIMVLVQSLGNLIIRKFTNEKIEFKFK